MTQLGTVSSKFLAIIEHTIGTFKYVFRMEFF